MLVLLVGWQIYPVPKKRILEAIWQILLLLCILLRLVRAATVRGRLLLIGDVVNEKSEDDTVFGVVCVLQIDQCHVLACDHRGHFVD